MIGLGSFLLELVPLFVRHTEKNNTVFIKKTRMEVKKLLSLISLQLLFLLMMIYQVNGLLLIFTVYQWPKFCLISLIFSIAL